MHSAILVLHSYKDANIPKTMNHQTHALVLNLIGQFNMNLSVRLHNEPGYRPFTVSSLRGLEVSSDQLLLRHDKPCYVRITLFDDGIIWPQLLKYFLESEPIFVQMGHVTLRLTNLLTTPDNDPTGWACTTDWQTLSALAGKPALTMH